MPRFNVTIRRLIEQEAKIVVTIPEGEVPLSNLPDFDDPNITWERTRASELSHDCSPIIEETPAPEIAELDEAVTEQGQNETPDWRLRETEEEAT